WRVASSVLGIAYIRDVLETDRFLECLRGTPIISNCFGGPMTHSFQNMRRSCRWLPVVVFMAGCVATGLLAQTGQREAGESIQLEIGRPSNANLLAASRTTITSHWKPVNTPSCWWNPLASS